MVKLNLPNDVLEVLRNSASALTQGLAEALHKKAEIEKEIEDMQSKLAGLESLIQEPSIEAGKDESSGGSISKESPNELVNLPLGRASLRVLKARGKYMTATEIVKALKEAGRVMTSPNSRDMVTMSLKKRPKDQIQIRTDGQANRYKAK